MSSSSNAEGRGVKWNKFKKGVGKIGGLHKIGGLGTFCQLWHYY